MAILKIISHGKSGKSARNVLSYILDAKKTEPGLCGLIGDFECHTVAPTDIYRDFQRVRNLFGKEESSGRVTTHGTVSWAPGEITHEEAAVFAREFLEKIYPKQQVVYAVHCDTDHIHFHYVANTVSYLDGAMLHWSKHDLENAKRYAMKCVQSVASPLRRRATIKTGLYLTAEKSQFGVKTSIIKLCLTPRRVISLTRLCPYRGPSATAAVKKRFVPVWRRNTVGALSGATARNTLPLLTQTATVCVTVIYLRPLIWKFQRRGY